MPVAASAVPVAARGEATVAHPHHPTEDAAERVAAAAEASNEAERAVMTASDARARTAEAAQQARTALERLRDQSRGADREAARAAAAVTSVDDREAQLEAELQRVERRRDPFRFEVDALYLRLAAQPR